MSVQPDVIGTRLRRSDGRLILSRRYRVTNPGGSGDTKLLNVLNSLPPDGAPHESIGGIFFLEAAIESEARDPNIFVVDTTWAEKPPGTRIDEGIGEGGANQTISFVTDTFSEATIRDRNGELMVIQFVEPELGGAGFGLSITRQVVNFEIQRPTSSVRITRTEDPALAKRFIQQGKVGNINSVPWSGFPSKTWLFRGTNSEQQSGQDARTTYLFTHNPGTWRAEGRFSKSGRVPENATIENGIAFFDVYQEFDFNTLGVTF